METTSPRFTEQAPLTVQAAAAEAVSELIDMAAGIDRTIAGLTALRAQVVEKATAWNESAASEGLSKELQFRSFRAELACALRIPERTAENLMATSRSLVSRWSRRVSLGTNTCLKQVFHRRKRPRTRAA